MYYGPPNGQEPQSKGTAQEHQRLLLWEPQACLRLLLTFLGSVTQVHVHLHAAATGRPSHADVFLTDGFSTHQAMFTSSRLAPGFMQYCGTSIWMMRVKATGLR